MNYGKQFIKPWIYGVYNFLESTDLLRNKVKNHLKPFPVGLAAYYFD
jgi:hypothetical protein